jgi:hypothetical protein
MLLCIPQELCIECQLEASDVCIIGASQPFFNVHIFEQLVSFI